MRGQTAAKEILGRGHLNMEPVGFLDDDPHKKGTQILGLRVLGSTEELPNIVESYEVDEVIISTRSTTHSTRS